MNSAINLLSILGSAQAIVLAAVFLMRRDANRYNRWLSGLFLLLGLTLLSISLPNGEVVNRAYLYEAIEYSLTFAAGPLLYLLALRFLGRPFPSATIVLLHFVPLSLFVPAQLLPVSVSEPFILPVVVPMLYLQCYTLWLVAALILYRRRSGNIDEACRWLAMIAGMLVFLHAAQWIRYSFSEQAMFEQLVPLTGLAGVYLLTLYGFKSSRLLSFSDRSGTGHLTQAEVEACSRRLVGLLEEEKVYKNPALTIEELAEHMDIPYYRLSELINTAFGQGFNEFINGYRVEEAKQLLSDASFGHLTIEALAKEAGFHSRSSFYKAFKKRTGTTPTSFQA